MNNQNLLNQAVRVKAKSGDLVRNIQKVPSDNDCGYAFVFEAKIEGGRGWNKYGPHNFGDWSFGNNSTSYSIKIGFWELQNIWNANPAIRQVPETYISSNGIITGMSVSDARKQAIEELGKLSRRLAQGDFLSDKDFDSVIFLCTAIKEAVAPKE